MAPDPQEIVVVTGLPRSGTSMMMRMLAAGGLPALQDALRPADADNPHGYFEFEPVKATREDPSWLAAAPGRAVKVVHALIRDLPTDRPYAVLVMRRDLGEVLASQRKMLDRSGRQGAGVAADALARVFAAQMAEMGRWLDAHACFRRLDVHYDRVLADPAGQAAAVAAFLHRGDARAMAGAVDAALYRNRAAPREP